MRLSVKIDTEEKKRDENPSVQKTSLLITDLSPAFVYYTYILSREPSLAILLDVHGHT